MIEITCALITDLDEVDALEHICFSHPWSFSSISSEFQNPDSYFAVAREDGTVIGFAVLRLISGEAEVMNIAVHPEKRGNGVGAALLDFILRFAKENAVSRVFLEARVGNTPALSLYKSRGFRRFSTRKNYYGSPNEDAAVMGKDLQ